MEFSGNLDLKVQCHPELSERNQSILTYLQGDGGWHAADEAGLVQYAGEVGRTAPWCWRCLQALRGVQNSQDCQDRLKRTYKRFIPPLVSGHDRCRCSTSKTANNVREAVALPPDYAAPWNAACWSLQRLEKQRQYNQDAAERRLHGAFVEEESKGFWWRSAKESRPKGSFHGNMPALLDACCGRPIRARCARNTEPPQLENYGENISFNLTRSLTPEREKVREALGVIGRETDELLIHEEKGKRARDLGFASVVLASCDMEKHDVLGRVHLDCRRGPVLELLCGYLQTPNLNMGFMGLFRCYKPSLLPSAACPHLHLLAAVGPRLREKYFFDR